MELLVCSFILNCFGDLQSLTKWQGSSFWVIQVAVWLHGLSVVETLLPGHLDLCAVACARKEVMVKSSGTSRTESVL